MGAGFLLFGVIFIAGFIVQQRLQAVFRKYSQTPLRTSLTGREVAEKMLQQNGIYDVRVISTEGELSDHYNPANRTVNLSKDVYWGKSIASAAVAAHECGHAIQHKEAYPMLQLRSSIVPIVTFASQSVQWVLLAGVLLLSVTPLLFIAGIALLAITAIFSLVTLPVEFDASARAMNWLRRSGTTTSSEEGSVKESLDWAARTYIVAAIASVATLIYYLGFLRRD